MRHIWLFMLFMTPLQYALGQGVIYDGPEVDLTVSDMRMSLTVIPPDQISLIKGNPKKLRQLMDSTYMTKVAAFRARQKGLDSLPEVRARIWNQTANILAVAEMNDVVGKAAGSAQYEIAAREYYQTNREKYRTPVEVRASHILIKAAGRGDAEALAEIERIRRKIVSGEFSFEEAAKQFSEDKGSASKGGALGRFSKGQMVKPFAEAVFAMDQAGSISEPVKTNFGYHIIWLDEKFPSTIQPFESVKEKIITGLQKKQRTVIREQYLIDIRDDPRVKVDQKAVDKFIANPEQE